MHVKTHSTGTSRFPAAELVFGGMQVEPGVHDAIVTVIVNGVSSKFNIFCKASPELDLNETIATMSPNKTWRGDILVMKMGKRAPGVVNWRGADNYLANLVVKERVTSSRCIFCSCTNFNLFTVGSSKGLNR